MQAPNDGAAGVSLQGCVTQGSFQNNVFTNSVYGISIDDNPTVASLPSGVHVFTIKHNSFERLVAGGVITYGDSLYLDEVSDNRFVNISRVVTNDPSTPGAALSVGFLRLGKVRRNQFIGNDSGIWLSLPNGTAAPRLRHGR